MNAPIDRFARGQSRAMTDAQKRGALVFFSKASCVQCHAVAGGSNELFSDLENHVAGPIAPVLQRIDPALAQPVTLTDAQFADLLAFLRDGLLDERALPENLAQLIPTSVPIGLSLHTFESTPPTPWLSRTSRKEFSRS